MDRKKDFTAEELMRFLEYCKEEGLSKVMDKVQRLIDQKSASYKLCDIDQPCCVQFPYLCDAECLRDAELAEPAEERK